MGIGFVIRSWAVFFFLAGLAIGLTGGGHWFDRGTSIGLAGQVGGDWCDRWCSLLHVSCRAFHFFVG